MVTPTRRLIPRRYYSPAYIALRVIGHEPQAAVLPGRYVQPGLLPDEQLAASQSRIILRAERKTLRVKGLRTPYQNV